LIGDVKDRDDSVAAKRSQAVVGLTSQEHVAREKRHDRLDPPALGSAAFLFRLR
jgi:hypothetical protein